MTEKLDILLREGHLADQPDFEKLHKNYHSKVLKLRRAKAVADRAHNIYLEKGLTGRLDILFTLEPKTAAFIAKYRKKIAKAELELERARLELWLDLFLGNPERADLSKYLDKKIKEARKKGKKQEGKQAEKPPAKATKKPKQ